MESFFEVVASIAAARISPTLPEQADGDSLHMPLSTEVNLPRSHHARYPPRCVRCGADPQRRTVLIWTHTIGWWTAVFWIFGWGFSTRPPACASCAWQIRLQRVGGLLLTLLVTGLFLTFIWPLLDGFVPRLVRNWVALVLVLACLTPYFLWEVFFPPAIDITAYRKSVDYQFKDAIYAYDFAELNDEAEWVRIS